MILLTFVLHIIISMIFLDNFMIILKLYIILVCILSITANQLVLFF